MVIGKDDPQEKPFNKKELWISGKGEK